MEAATLTPAGPAAPPRLLKAASDERLVARLRSGDERCFEVIYDRYHLPLLSFCRHMVGSREEAEDALQQVFVSAHGQLLRDDRPVQLRAWLYAIARNRCLSVLRARRETVALDDVGEPSAEGLAVAAQVQQRQDLKDILRDLAMLPDDQRAALVLAELEDLSHEEIAVALDVRKDKVKALVFQAREALMGFREARDADCGEIREQLATLRGGALRRTPMQRHLAICAGCAAFKADVKRQRAALGAVLPVVPAFALKEQILGAVHAASTVGAGAGVAAQAAGVAAGVGGSASGGAAAAGGSVAAAGTGVAATAMTGGASGGVLAAIGSSSLVVKVLTATAIVATTGGGAVAIKQATDERPAGRAPVTAPARATPLSGTQAPAVATTPAAAAAAAAAAAGAAAAATTTGNGRAAGERGPGTSSSSSASGKAANGRSPGGAPNASGSANGNGNGAAKSSGATNGRGTQKTTPAAKGKPATAAKPKSKAPVPKGTPTFQGSKRPATSIPPSATTTPTAPRRPATASNGSTTPKSSAGRPAPTQTTVTSPADPASDPAG